MSFQSTSTLQQPDDVSAAAAASSGSLGGGGGGASTWDDLSGELSGPVPFDATDEDGNPTSRSLQFLNVTPQVDVTSDPANGIALEIKDQTNGTRLGTLTTDGRWETRADQEAFADGSFNSGQGTNSLLSVENSQGDVLTTDAASLQFTGSGVSVTEPNPDEIVVDVSGGSNVGSLSDLSDVSSATQGDGNVLASDGTSYSEETVQGLFDAHVSLSASDVSGVSADSVTDAHHAKYTDSDAVSAIGASTPFANADLSNDTVTVAGNSVSLGNSTAINHGDLSSIGSSDHHTKTTSAADLTDVSADSVRDAHHPEYTDEKAQDAVNALLSGGNGISLSYDDFNDTLTISSTVSNTDTQTDLENVAGVVVSDANGIAFDAGANTTVSVSSDNDGTGTVLISSTDTDTQLSDNEVQTAINNDSDHGSTASHNYTTSASGLTDVSPDSDPDAHHAVFEPADYNPVSDVEAHGNALAIDISGDADTLDNVEGSNYARTDVSETFNFNVGFGGQTSPSYAIEATGDMRATGEIEAFISSDRRLKTGLNPLDSALDKVGQLTGYGFDWREGDAVQPHKRGRADVGLIAQEVEGVLPEAVKTFTDGHSEGYKSVSYDKLVPILVEAIKDLRSQVRNLQ